MAVGFIVTLPSTATAPAPLSIETLSASVVVQLKVAESPAAIEFGVAEKLSTVGGPGDAGSTVTVTFANYSPPEPVAART